MQDFPAGTLITGIMSTIGHVSVPGAKPMGEVEGVEPSPSIPVVPMLGRMSPTVRIDSNVAVAAGNVADFEERWQYFLDDTFPAFKAMVDDPDNPYGTVADGTSEDMHTRIDERRLHHQVDDLAGRDWIDADLDWEWPWE